MHLRMFDQIIWFRCPPNSVTLSKTKKKGRDHKEAILSGIKQALDDYGAAYVFAFKNMRNQKFKEFREQLKSNSRFIWGNIDSFQSHFGVICDGC